MAGGRLIQTILLAAYRGIPTLSFPSEEKRGSPQSGLLRWQTD